MAQARLIYKSLYTNPEVGELEISVRYFYQALIVHADDEGRLRADTRHLKTSYRPPSLAVIDSSLPKNPGSA